MLFREKLVTRFGNEGYKRFCMSIPQNKDELLSAIDKTFSKLFEDLKTVPADITNLPKMEGHAKGTEMSVSDLAAYLIGWNVLVLKWLDHDKKGLPIDFPETGFKWNELGKLANKFYDDYKNVPFPNLLQQLETAKDKIVKEIASRSNESLYEKEWCGKWTMGRMIQLNTSSPYSNARNRLRKWFKTL